MVRWLNGWLNCWLADWLLGWLAGWLLGGSSCVYTSTKRFEA